MTHGCYHIEITHATSEDFARRIQTITLQRYDGKQLRWALPDRLIMREDVFKIAVDEMAAEIEERHPL
jgi:hypothetical protein